MTPNPNGLDGRFRLTWTPVSPGVGDGQSAAASWTEDYATLDDAKAAMDGPKPGYQPQTIRRLADGLIFWPNPGSFGAGDLVWIADSPHGNLVAKGVLIGFVGHTDRLDKLWQVRLGDGREPVHVTEQLLRPRAAV